MQNFPKLLISIGLLFLLIGLLWQMGAKFFPLGKLPGDISIEKENFKFYLPIGTSIVLSIILSLIFWIFSRIKT